MSYSNQTIDERLTYEQNGNKWDKRVTLAGASSGAGLRVMDVSPIWTHKRPQTLAEVTNGADGTYTYYVDMDGYRHLSLSLVLDGGSGSVTVTVEATAQDDGSAPGDCAYTDVTNAVFGAATFTASNFLSDSARKLAGAKFVKVKVVASTGAADDADWSIYARQTW